MTFELVVKGFKERTLSYVKEEGKSDDYSDQTQILCLCVYRGAKD